MTLKVQMEEAVNNQSSKAEPYQISGMDDQLLERDPIMVGWIQFNSIQSVLFRYIEVHDAIYNNCGYLGEDCNQTCLVVVIPTCVSMLVC